MAAFTETPLINTVRSPGSLMIVLVIVQIKASEYTSGMVIMTLPSMKWSGSTGPPTGRNNRFSMVSMATLVLVVILGVPGAFRIYSW